MSGTTSDRLTALEAESTALQAENTALQDRMAALETEKTDLIARVTALEAAATKPAGGASPGLQDTAGDLAALDAWLIAQTGVSLEYQLQRMCAQFYGNPLMPPS